MRGRNGRGILAASAILLAASLVRLSLSPSGQPPLLPVDSAGIRDELAEESRRARAERERRRRPLAEGERLDPNNAPAAELERLHGVGPRVASAIVEEREEGGPFLRVGDLVRVKGIGPRTLERIAPHLEIPPGRGVSVTRKPGAGTEHRASRITLPGAGRDAGKGPSRTVDLNRADEVELQALPGIGPALASRIVAHRRRRGGRFTRAEELLEVRGIGPRTLERIRRAGVRPP